MLVLVEGGKPENPEKDSRSRDENQQQTQPTYEAGSGNRTRAILAGGECFHHCAIPATVVIVAHHGLMVSALDCRSSGLGQSPGQGSASCSWARHFTIIVSPSTQLLSGNPVVD